MKPLTATTFALTLPTITAAYTHHSMDRNRAYHTLAIIRLSDYNYIDKV